MGGVEIHLGEGREGEGVVRKRSKKSVDMGKGGSMRERIVKGRIIIAG